MRGVDEMLRIDKDPVFIWFFRVGQASTGQRGKLGLVRRQTRIYKHNKINKLYLIDFIIYFISI